MAAKPPIFAGGRKGVLRVPIQLECISRGAERGEMYTLSTSGGGWGGGGGAAAARKE